MSLLADYKFTEGSGTTAGDNNGGANDATITNPVWTSKGLTIAGSRYVTLPAAVYTGFNTAHIMISGRTSGNTTIYVLTNTDQTFAFTNNVFTPMAYGDMMPRLQTPADTYQYMGSSLTDQDVAVLSIAFDTTNGHRLYVNGRKVNYYFTRTNQAVTRTGTGYLCGYGPALAFAALDGLLARAVFYSESRDDATIAADVATILAEEAVRGNVTRDTSRQSGNALLHLGDSRTNQMTLNATNVPTTQTFARRYNHGVVGITTADLYKFAQDVYTLKNPASTWNIAIVWAGVNDVGTQYASLVTLCQFLRANGYRVIVCTEISSFNFDAAKNALNAQILAGHGSFADGVARLDQTALGADGAYANATYFSDTVHPTAAGRAILYPVISAAINLLTDPLGQAATIRPLRQFRNRTLQRM